MKKQKFKVKKGKESVLSVFSKIQNVERISMTGYTMEAETKDEIFFYSDEQMHPLIFGYYSKLKKELEKVENPKTEQSEVKYFNFKKGIISGKEYNEVFCVDINSAYLSALKKDGKISKELFQEINTKATKEQRLKCVGMLAKSKCHFYFENGSMHDVYFESSHLEGFFYYACHVTGKAMQKCERAIGEEFLFFWVDGIFVTSEKAANDCRDLLIGEGFECKIERVQKMKFTKSFVIFEKNGKKKFQSIPNKTSPKTFINIAEQLQQQINKLNENNLK